MPSHLLSDTIDKIPYHISIYSESIREHTISTSISLSIHSKPLDSSSDRFLPHHVITFSIHSEATWLIAFFSSSDMLEAITPSMMTCALAWTVLEWPVAGSYSRAEYCQLALGYGPSVTIQNNFRICPIRHFLWDSLILLETWTAGDIGLETWVARMVYKRSKRRRKQGWRRKRQNGIIDDS